MLPWCFKYVLIWLVFLGESWLMCNWIINSWFLEEMRAGERYGGRVEPTALTEIEPSSAKETNRHYWLWSSNHNGIALFAPESIASPRKPLTWYRLLTKRPPMTHQTRISFVHGAKIITRCGVSLWVQIQALGQWWSWVCVAVEKRWGCRVGWFGSW